MYYQDNLITLHMLLGYDTVYILYNENTQDRTLSQDIAPSLKLCNYCVLITLMHNNECVMYSSHDP